MTDADKSAPPPAQPSEEGRFITLGNTVVKVVGAGVGKNKQTSGVWKYVMECFVKRKLPGGCLRTPDEIPKS